MNYIKNTIFFSLLFLTISCYGIVIVEPSAQEAKKSYRTVAELKKFFKKHGMQYLEHNEFLYAPILKRDMKKDSYYRDHKDTADFLTEKYADQVRKCHRAPIELRWVSKNVGYGVFAYKSIKKGDFIAIYTGQVDYKENIADKDYCWAYPVCADNKKPLSCDSKYKGNEMRYVNHSYAANVIMKYILVDNVWYVCYLAIENIPAGGQLLVDYGSNYWKTRSIQCEDL